MRLTNNESSGLPFLMLIVVFMMCCRAKPSVDLSVIGDPGIPTFTVDAKGINGLLSILVWTKGSKEVLWDVSLDYYNGKTIRYGKVPVDFITQNGNLSSGKQVFPVNNEFPKTIVENEAVYVMITYQFDSWLSASASHTVFSFVAKEGKITNHGAIRDIRSEDFPDRNYGFSSD